MSEQALKNAIRLTAHEYGCSGNHDADLISNAFKRLLQNFENELKEESLQEDLAHNEAMDRVYGSHGQG